MFRYISDSLFQSKITHLENMFNMVIFMWISFQHKIPYAVDYNSKINGLLQDGCKTFFSRDATTKNRPRNQLTY